MRRAAVRRLVTVSFVFVVGACSGPSSPATASPSAQASALTAVATPTLEPADTPEPSLATQTAPPATPAPTDNPDPCVRRPYTGPWTIDPLMPGSAVRVAVAELNLRAGPCAAAQRVEVLKKGDILVVFGPYGPFKANGFPWYEVQKAKVAADGSLVPLPASPVTIGPDVVGGWIAANDGTVPYVTPVAARCPTTINLKNVRGMLDAERLACFSEPIVLTGTFGCGGCGGTGGPQSDPIWLAETFQFDHLWVHWFKDEHPISIQFKPSGPKKPPEGKIIRVTVHVDDPAAQKCTFYYGLEEPAFVEPKELGIAWCRERFVVDSYEIMGTDPYYH